MKEILTILGCVVVSAITTRVVTRRKNKLWKSIYEIALNNNQILITMNEKLSEIKADLVESKAKLEKVSADVTRLHAKIDSIGEMPTTEEWAEVKTLSEELKVGLTSVDEQTPEETTP